MKNFIKNLSALAVLTTLIGCSKPSSSVPSSQPTPTWNLEAHAQDVREYLAIKNEPRTTNAPTPHTVNPIQPFPSSPTNPSALLSSSSTTNSLPAGYIAAHTNYIQLTRQLAETQKSQAQLQKNFGGLQTSNATLRTQLTKQFYTLAAVEERARLETQATHSFSNNYVRALGTNEAQARQLVQARDTAKAQQATIQKYEATTRNLLNDNNRLGSSLAEEQIGHRRTKHVLSEYQQEEREAKALKQRIQIENVLVQTLLATPGYTLPGSPLITANIQGKRLENLTTYQFALPRVIITTKQLGETLAHLGALGYKATNTQGAFSNWVHQAGLPLKAFPDYKNTPLQHDRAAALCKAYALSLNGPLPGIVTWTSTNGVHMIGTENGFNTWRGEK